MKLKWKQVKSVEEAGPDELDDMSETLVAELEKKLAAGTASASSPSL